MTILSLKYDSNSSRRHERARRHPAVNKLFDDYVDSDSDHEDPDESDYGSMRHEARASNANVSNIWYPDRSLIQHHGATPSHSNRAWAVHHPQWSNVRVVGHHPETSIIGVLGERQANVRYSQQISSPKVISVAQSQMRTREIKHFSFAESRTEAAGKMMHSGLRWQSVRLITFKSVSEPMIRHGMTRDYKHLRSIYFESVCFPGPRTESPYQSVVIYGWDRLCNKWFSILIHIFEFGTSRSFDSANALKIPFKFTATPPENEIYLLAALKMSLAQGAVRIDADSLPPESRRFTLWTKLVDHLSSLTYCFKDQISDEVGELFTTALPEDTKGWYSQPFSNFPKDGELQDALATWHYSRISKGRTRSRLRRLEVTDVRPWEYDFLPGGPLMKNLR
jgi:hypothetical protein